MIKYIFYFLDFILFSLLFVICSKLFPQNIDTKFMLTIVAVYIALKLVIQGIYHKFVRNKQAELQKIK